MSREKKLVKNTFILSIGTFLPKFASFITLPILTACLTKEQYGTYDLLTVLVSLVLPVCTLQIHTAAFRFLIENRDNKRLARLYTSNILAFVLPVSFITLLILFFVLPISNIGIKAWVCIYFFFDIIVTEIRQIARGLSRNLDYSISAIISAIAKMVFALLLVQEFQQELYGAVVSLALSSLISSIYISTRIHLARYIDFKLVNKSVLKEMLSYSWPMVPNNMSGWVMKVSDRFVVTGVLGLSANAVYAVANKFPSLLSLAQTAFTMAWQENASIASKDEDAGKYYSEMFSVMIKFYAGCLGLIIAATPFLFKVLIRGDYSDAFPQMPLLFVAMFFECMSSFIGGIYIAQKATKSVGLTTLAAACCNLLVDILLIKKIGLYAASGSTLVSYILLFVYRVINVKRIINIKFQNKTIILSLSVIVIECCLSYIDNYAVYIANIFIGIIAFVFLNKEILYGLYRKARGLTSHNDKN